MTVAVRPMTGAERMLAASRCQPVDATPVWFMRQAGRSLADYRQLREQYSILTLAKTPELCSRVTLMPVEQLGKTSTGSSNPGKPTSPPRFI